MSRAEQLLLLELNVQIGLAIVGIAIVVLLALLAYVAYTQRRNQ